MKLKQDINGNQILSISGADLGDNRLRGFSVQTNGNLPVTHNNGITDTTTTELFDFISEHGTARQRELLQTDQPFTLDNVKSQRLNHRHYWRQLTDQDCSDIADLLCDGCRVTTRINVFNSLCRIHDYTGPGWWLSRFKFRRGSWDYCTAQDSIQEHRTIRAELTK